MAGLLSFDRSLVSCPHALRASKIIAGTQEVFPFEQVRAMHEKLEGRGVSGKLLLAVQPS